MKSTKASDGKKELDNLIFHLWSLTIDPMPNSLETHYTTDTHFNMNMHSHDRLCIDTHLKRHIKGHSKADKCVKFNHELEGSHATYTKQT